MWQRRWLTPAASGAAQPGIDEDLIPVLIQVNYALQETAKSTRVQITYDSPLVSYVIYEGQCKRS
jgi:hypothetical protein